MFYHRLAAHRGISVQRLLEETDSLELAEAQAVDRLEPIDWVRRLELANAIVAMTVANFHRGEDQDPFKVSDFMVDWGAEYRDPIPVDPKIAIAQLEGAIESMGLTWQ